MAAGVGVAFAWRPVVSAVALERGRAALARHDPRAAADLLVPAAADDPRNAPLALAALVAARRAGDFEDDPPALDAALRRAARLGADREDVRRERVLAAAAAGRLDGPGGVWEELPGLLADDRGDLGGICAAYVRGLCLLHRFAAARWLLDRWDGAAPDDPRAAYLRGLLELSLENADEAGRQFRRAVALAPHHVGAKVQLAKVLRTAEGDPAAGAALLADVAADSDDPDALGEYGLCLLAADRPADAVPPLRRAVAAAPGDLDRRRPLGEALLAAGDPAAALDAVDPLLAAWPGDVRGGRLRGRALRELGRGKDAAGAFAAAQAHDAARGAMYALAREANAAEAPGADLLYELGSVLLEHEDRREGMAYLTAAVRADRRHGPAHAALARAHAAAGRPEFARRHRRLAARFGAGGGRTQAGDGRNRAEDNRSQSP